jgi:hypothetical protein
MLATLKDIMVCWLQVDRSARCKVVGCEVLLLRCLSNSNLLCDMWLQRGKGQRKLMLFMLRLGC